MSTLLLEQGIGLWFNQHTAVPLERVEVSAELSSPIAITRIKQHYRNVQLYPIEARYVFPIPVKATLLSLTMRLNSRVIKGIVKAKKAAEHLYEEALVKGDAAVLLTKLSDGMYQIMLGNLLSNEVAEIEVTWSECLRYESGQFNYRLPNVIGQHYGMPEKAGISIVDAPSHSSLTAYEFSFCAQLMGELAQSSIKSPTHRLSVKTSDKKALISVSGEDWLDRSFVLQLSTDTPVSSAWYVPDGDGLAVLSSIMPPHLNERENPLALTVLVDGSGSMQGTAIRQAQIAVSQIMKQLRPSDSGLLITFGNDTKLITPKRMTGELMNREINSLIHKVNADMGGTEMIQAIERAIQYTPECGDILIITDGQMYASDADLARLIRHKCRFFIVGVGLATSEALLQKLAEDSGGACILVSANDDMSTLIVQHFQRMRALSLSLEIDWPSQTIAIHQPKVIFGGDTALVCCRLNNLDTFEQKQVIHVKTGQAEVKVQLKPANGLLAEFLPRIVAEKLLPKNNISELRAQAIKYQLITDETALVAVLVRDLLQSEVSLPTIVDVPQMIVSDRALSISSDVYADFDKPAYMRYKRASTTEHDYSFLENIPAFLKKMLINDYGRNDSSGSSMSKLILLNGNLSLGGNLSEKLVRSSLPFEWMPIFDELKNEWPEDLLIFYIIYVGLDFLGYKDLRKLRQLKKSVFMMKHSFKANDELTDKVKKFMKSIY